MVGTKESVSGVSAPVMLVLWVVVQRGGHFFLSYQGPFFKGSVDGGWQGPRKGVFNLFTSVLQVVFSIVLRARSPCSSDAKLVGAGVMASCKPASLAL